jgi:hypothetical protein
MRRIGGVFRRRDKLILKKRTILSCGVFCRNACYAQRLEIRQFFIGKSAVGKFLGDWRQYFYGSCWSGISKDLTVKVGTANEVCK